jgi:hypothetical protein
MQGRSPEELAIISYIWVFVLAMFGGAVSYLRKLKNGRKWKVTDFLIEITTAAFAGLITFFICNWAGIDTSLSAALTGISGHFSSKAITLFGKLFDKVMSKVV